MDEERGFVFHASDGDVELNIDQVMVDLANSISYCIDEDPKNGSFLPHWYKRPRAPTSPGVALVAPRLRSIIVPALL